MCVLSAVSPIPPKPPPAGKLPGTSAWRRELVGQCDNDAGRVRWCYPHGTRWGGSGKIPTATVVSVLSLFSLFLSFILILVNSDLCAEMFESVFPLLCFSAVMQLNDTVLTLNSSAQLVHGVKLSKDQTGVTAEMSLSNYNISVFFDGYTAQIHLKGTENKILHQVPICVIRTSN